MRQRFTRPNEAATEAMLPHTIPPMLAQKCRCPFDSDRHLFEIKWDGIRCLAFVQGERVRLQTRQLTQVTLQFPELGCLRRLPSGTVLDGELVIFQEGKPSLRYVQQRAWLQNGHRIQTFSRVSPATLMVFDLLYFKGKSLMAEALISRRDRLVAILDRVALPGVVATEAICRHGRRMFDQAIRLGLEGLMAKHLESPYLPGKRPCHWVKIKPVARVHPLAEAERNCENLTAETLGW